MELYLDTANVAEVERLARIFPLPGATNPSIIAASKESIWKSAAASAKGLVMRAFCSLRHQPRQGWWKKRSVCATPFRALWVKIPATSEGLAAIKMLKKEGITTLGTAV